MKVKLDKFLEWLLAILLAVMVVDVLWGVFTRYVMGHQSSWTDELARFLLIWVGVLGAAYAVGRDMHIAIDLLPHYLNAKNQKRLQFFNAVIVVLFALAVFIIGGSRYVYISFHLGQSSSALGLPMGYVYMIFPISGIIIIYYKIQSIFSDI